MRATLSILGLYNFDDTIFDTMVIPEDLEKNYLVHEILTDYAELEVLYPNPDVMKNAIANWSNMRLHSWQKMVAVLYEEYNPFINIKRDEHREITQERDLAGTGQSVNSVSAWNETTFTDRGKDVTSTSDTGTVTTTEDFHVEGDSAITDAQDVAKKEIELRARYDMYQIIKNEFKNRFLLQIY